MGGITRGLFSSERDDWETPQELFDSLDRKYGFTLDPCATDATAKCAKHYTAENDGLVKSWQGERVFVNPPYGRKIADWVAKCDAESDGALIVALLPARTDTRWFHDHINGKADIRFIRGRVRFERGGVAMENAAPFPSVLVRW